MAPPSPEPVEFPQLEKTSGSFRALLTDEFGAPLAGDLLIDLRLTLYDTDAAQTIINGRDNQAVLNANGVTVYATPQIDSAGRAYTLEWVIDEADNPIRRPALAHERHVALFTYRWGAGRVGRAEVILVVRNLAKVS